jgi:hypothetical protein
MSKGTVKAGFQTKSGRLEAAPKGKRESAVVKHIPDKGEPSPLPREPEAFAADLLEEDAVIMDYLAK